MSIKLRFSKGLNIFLFSSLKEDRKSNKKKNSPPVNDNSPQVNADHILPKDSVRQAWDRTKDKPKLQEKLKNTNPKLYEMIESIKDDNNGRNLVAMEVLAVDHRFALTTGRSHYAQKSR